MGEPLGGAPQRGDRTKDLERVVVNTIV
jgi:IS5 family transposase